MNNAANNTKAMMAQAAEAKANREAERAYWEALAKRKAAGK